MLRYAKGTPLPVNVGEYQAAAIHGMICEIDDEEGAEPDKALCLTLDVQTGKVHVAPGNAATIFANMKAACASIAEQWPNLPPPKNAVL